MTTQLPELDLKPGRHHCLHLPPSAYYPEEDLRQQIVRMAMALGKTIVVAERHLRGQRTIDWLLAEGLTRSQANRLVSTYSIPDLISVCAGGPTVTLGLAAAFARAPDVIVYDLAGLDHEWRTSVAAFVASSQQQGSCSLIHLSYPTNQQTPHMEPRLGCPQREGTCWELV